MTADTTAADLVAYYRAYGSRNVRKAEGRLKQLPRYFGAMKLAEIDAAAILGYVAHRQRQGRAAATINLARVREIEREMSTLIPWLFPHLHGRQQGKRIKSFRKTWTKACREAGCPGKLRHDLRRTAARNMINLGGTGACDNGSAGPQDDQHAAPILHRVAF